ncbi:MAG: septum formation initiator family protein [Candidatus Pacebacteria bacterium]|nr:septum formation initiator family protein [Candidatus Paceibacterota bacterium]
MPILQRKILTAGLFLLVVWLGYRSWQIHGKKIETNVQIKDLQSRVVGLERNNQFLASSSAYFASDAYLERQARLKLNYKLSDEHVAFVYKDKSVKVASSSVDFKNKLAEMPNWKKWWYYLLGYQ